ncbi:MAG: cell division protein FtsZ [Armatimonadetes bacterium]|nr:cell division protein FtsZ [Armatimonadota bacterium]
MSPKNLFESQAIIKVVGVGGGGCNAVNRMVSAGVQGVEFIAMNTDKQALDGSLAHIKVPLGESQTRGLGTGGDPEKGYQAAKESDRTILELIEGADMVFVTAGMGGGTGTGAAPYVAELAKRLDILTVGVVTKPFGFEGPRRRQNADSGLERMKERTDTLIVIPNDNLSRVVERRTSLGEAFCAADEVLLQGVQGISDIVLKPGLINVDFADVRSVLKDAGIALMGMGRGIGEQRARTAAEAAANSPLLETTIQGAKRLLVNVTSGPDFSLGEAHDVMEYLVQLTDSEEASIFLGQVIDDSLGEDVQVTLLAAGLTGSERKALDQEVFTTGQPRASRESSTPSTSTVRSEPKPIEIDELDLDIPTFLRKQRLGS